MRYQRFGTRFQIRLESGDKVMASLVGLAEKEGITYAAFTGLGAVRSASVAWYNVESHQYETHDLVEQLEVNSLMGNISLRDGKPFAHAHVNLGRRDLSVIGGHLMDAEAHSTLEIWMRSEPAEVHRRADPGSGLALLDLPEQL